MAENNRREREIAISKGHVDADGTPYITVAADGSWSHRSYGHRYTAKSGTAIIVGKETKGLLFLGIRNKYCYICAVAERAKRAWPQHTCFKNWNKSSPAMEADIIVQGFLESEKLHGIRYKKLIGDGDSSVLKQLVERCPYGRQIIKVECVNHLLKNRTKELYELQKKWSKSKEKVPGEDNRNYEKEFLKDNRIKQIGKTVRGVVEDLSESTEDAASISAIIRNLGAHCTGDHTKCRMEYCPKSGQRQNTYNLSTAFLFELTDIIGRLTEHTSSIMEYQTTNLCECLMSLISKYTGAKQVFYGRRASYTYRVHGAGLNFNNGQHWRSKMHRFRYKESPPSLLKRMDNKRAKRASGNAQRKRALKVQRRLFGSDSSASESDSDNSLADPISDPDEPSSSPNPSAYYGKTCQKPDLPQASLQEKMEQKLALLKVDLERRDIIESLTRDQDIRGRWGQEKLYRATASDFGRICLRRIGFDGDLVEQLVYRAPFNSVQVQWGKDHESEACAAFTTATGLQTKRCGIFIDIERPYLGASPDRVVVGEDAIVEVKCPYSARYMTVEEAVTNKKVPYLYKDPVSQQLKLKAKCPYMHQVQGQLAITGRKFCYFVVWTLKDCYIEKILYDEQMWKEMLPKLDNFYLKHMLVEFADPRKYRQMPLRHSKKEAGVQRSKKSSKRSRSDQSTNRKKRKEEIMPESLQKEVKEASPPRDPPHVTPPDVIVDNTTSLSPPKTKNVELRNGHLMPPVKTENRVIALSKTCAFDSFTTIIAEALRENKEYRNAAISYKENPLIDFCFMVAEQEDKNKIYEKRADILVQANIARISKVGDQMTGDCSVNISSVAEILRSAPSAARVDICMDTQCKRKRESSHAYLEPPLVLMSHLQQGAVQIIMKKMSVQIDELCKGCKKSPRLTYYKAKIHLIILTDSYNDGSLLTMNPDFSGQFEIGKLDTHILFDNKRYVLSGVVVWRGTINQHNESDHYFAYIRLQTGEWELHDDLALTVQKNPSTGIPVKPHLIVYTISDEVTPAAV